MRYNVILFDADETLYDYAKSEAFALSGVFGEIDQECTDAIVDSYRRINQQLWHDFEQGKVTQSDLRTARFDRLLAEHDIKCALDANAFSDIYIKYLGQGSFLMEEAEELCSQLAERGQRMAIITNGIKEVQFNRISGSALCDSFECIIVSEDAGSQKPHEGIFDYAFDKLNHPDKKEVLIVGDSLTSDIQGGIRYGIDTCWYNPLRKANPTSIQPKYEIHSLMELHDIISSE
ncbi:noncanonical pyrimidine nucleotidase, YjjG family protein [Paenibacillus lautus]|uniref:YjjG family noncanonical pyrimidine nucleotidase n=1 Tax=Paenibacillus lautus TaxID=1401 RepID=UPI001B18D185|nr:YjjG family noncanonical pyrimidine nucleotidase [Paenibacillus lautus]GIO96772.1 noncanonical pyrimidine nucleotidase, YjjG family protein [Paenibacillus lautus]